MTKLRPKYCDRCGNPADLHNDFCMHCGAELTQMPVTIEKRPAAEKLSYFSRLIEKYKTPLENNLKKIIGDRTLDKNAKIDAIIHTTGIVCGIIALQPIPFADFFILTPLQIVMTLYIGRVYGFDISLKRAASIVGEILAVIGAGIMSMNAVIASYKFVLPYTGGAFTLPLVWGFTFGIGSAAKVYYSIRKNSTTRLTPEQKNSIKSAYVREYQDRKNTKSDKIKKEVEDLLKGIKDSGSAS